LTRQRPPTGVICVVGTLPLALAEEHHRLSVVGVSCSNDHVTACDARDCPSIVKTAECFMGGALPKAWKLGKKQVKTPSAAPVLHAVEDVSEGNVGKRTNDADR